MRDDAISVIRAGFPKIPYEIGFEDHGVAGVNPAAERIPLRRPEPFRIEAEEAQTLTHRLVHAIGMPARCRGDATVFGPSRPWRERGGGVIRRGASRY